jgi:hypothetical protein
MQRTAKRNAEYFAFDMLPPPIRSALNDLAIGTVESISLQCLAALRAGRAESDVLQQLHVLNARLFGRKL